MERRVVGKRLRGPAVDAQLTLLKFQTLTKGVQKKKTC